MEKKCTCGEIVECDQDGYIGEEGHYLCPCGLRKCEKSNCENTPHAKELLLL